MKTENMNKTEFGKKSRWIHRALWTALMSTALLQFIYGIADAALNLQKIGIFA